MTVKRIVFIRPGETDWNRSGRWQGRVAVPLNEHGIAQAQALARFVRNIGIGALYASPLRRAAQTAEIIAEKLGYAVIYDERLSERNIGHWQGLTPAEMSAWYSEEYTALMHDRLNYVIPGGESRLNVQTRMQAAFEDILAQDKGETVGVLSHSSAIRSLLMQWEQQDERINSEIGNTSVTTVARGNDSRWRVTVANDISHLEGLSTGNIAELDKK
jgi:broad specificity phosphatase PhoE